MIPQVKNFPANLLKFDSYIMVVDTLEAAIDVIKKKRLAYGQPAIVTYKSNSESTGKTLKRVLFGIGSMDPKDPYFFNIEYDSSGNPVEQSEIITKIEKIIDEWDKHGGFVQTSIKFSKIEPSNINDTEFLSGDIILGEASIKTFWYQSRNLKWNSFTMGNFEYLVNQKFKIFEQEYYYEKLRSKD